MISIFKSDGRGLQRLEQPTDGSWIHLTDPTPAEIARLGAEYHVPDDFLTYPLDIDEMPRTETSNGATLIGLRQPIFRGEQRGISYSTAPLAIASFAFNFNNFTIIYMLTGGGPAFPGSATGLGSTDILISAIYQISGVAGGAAATPRKLERSLA